MKLSTTTGIYNFRADGSYVAMSKCAHMCYDAGYRDIDLNFCRANEGIGELSDENWEDWAKRFREELDEMGMSASQSHTPFYRHTTGPFVKDEAIEEMSRRAVIASGILGVKAVTMHGIMDFDCDDFAKIKQMNVEYYKPYLELAEKCGTSIAVENLLDPVKPHHRRKYLDGASDVVDLVDTLKKDFGNVGVCWDTGHANKMGWHQEQSLKMIGDRLISTHINDNYGELDDHLFPYMGHVDWKEVMKALREIGYEGAFTYEAKFTTSLPDALVPDVMRYTVSLGNYLLTSV